MFEFFKLCFYIYITKKSYYIVIHKIRKNMTEKFEVEITLQGEGRAKIKMFVTQSEFELLVNLSEEINDPWQEAYSPNMYVRKLDQEN